MNLTHLTAKSANAKTGKIAVSTSSKSQCPATCPFRGNGCYAESGPLALHWAKVTNGDRGMAWPEFLAAIAALPAGRQFRHNQAGDIVDPNTSLGAQQLAELATASQGRKAWTYTHHRITTAKAAYAIRQATDSGFTVNASCDSAEHASAMLDHGIPAVFVCDSTETRTSWPIAGDNVAVLCPAQRIDGMTCETCGLCAQRPDNVAIAFAAHGTGKRKAEAAIAAAVG